MTDVSYRENTALLGLMFARRFIQKPHRDRRDNEGEVNQDVPQEFIVLNICRVHKDF